MQNIYIKRKELFVENKTSRKLFITLMSIFYFLFFLRDVVGLNIHSYYFLLMAMFMFIVFDQHEMIALAFSLTAISNGMQSNFALGIGLIIFFIKYGKLVKFTGLFLPFFILLIFELLHFIIPPFSFYEYIRLGMSFIFIGFVIGVNKSNINNQLILKTFIATTIFVMSIIFLYTLKSFNWSISEMLDKTFRLGFGVDDLSPDVFWIRNNANRLGMLCNIAVVSSLMLFATKKMKSVISVIFLCLILLFFGLLTISKAFIVGFIFIILYYFFIGTGEVRYIKSSSLFSGIIVFTVATAIVLIAFPQLITNVIDRFLVEDISTGRITIFVKLLSLIVSSTFIFIFGLGIQSKLDKIILYSDNTIRSVPHNAIEEIILLWGVIGLILMIWVIVSMIKSSKMINKKIKPINYLCLIALIFIVQFGQLITSFEAIMCLGISYLCLLLSKDDNVKDIK